MYVQSPSRRTCSNKAGSPNTSGGQQSRQKNNNKTRSTDDNLVLEIKSIQTGDFHYSVPLLSPSLLEHDPLQDRACQMQGQYLFLLPCLVYLPTTVAWGTLGHETIAWTAQSLISDTTASYVQEALESTASDYMANISTWADSYRYTSAGSWSAPLHFIDANDSPPGECDVEFNRDCGASGCVVSAIVNYTQIVLDEGSAKDERRDAMRFIIHFVGDIHQPLHVEGLDRGGNDINVTFGRAHTNLHHIWDTEIVEKLADGADAETWAQNFTQAINNGDFSGDASAWGQGISLDDTEGTALAWASDANKYVCSDVLAGGVDAVETGDLSGAYFKAHGEVARLQLAKAGYRLAKFLDLIATGNAGA